MALRVCRSNISSFYQWRTLVFNSVVPTQRLSKDWDVSQKREYSETKSENTSSQEANGSTDCNPKREKLLVLGGNGFVGTAVCKEAVKRGISVQSLNRSGPPSWSESWVDQVEWVRGDILQPEKWRHLLPQTSAVVSCVGAFGSTASMLKTNGHANVTAVNTASEEGVPRFVYISGHDVGLGLSRTVLKGYYDGKKMADNAVKEKFTYGGIIFRPAMIHGTRRVGSLSLPLSLIGAPLELVLKQMPWSRNLPLLGPALAPPVSVAELAKLVVDAAEENSFPPGVLDVWEILRLVKEAGSGRSF